MIGPNHKRQERTMKKKAQAPVLGALYKREGDGRLASLVHIDAKNGKVRLAILGDHAHAFTKILLQSFHAQWRLFRMPDGSLKTRRATTKKTRSKGASAAKKLRARPRRAPSLTIDPPDGSSAPRQAMAPEGDPPSPAIEYIPAHAPAPDLDSEPLADPLTPTGGTDE